jgi:hypothetical protein
MSIHIQTVAYYLERGDLASCASTHTVRIERSESAGDTIEAVVKRSIAFTPDGEQDVTLSLTREARKDVEVLALAQYFAAQAGPVYDHDGGPDNAA